MKYSDFIIDLNDIYGRLIPGIFLVLEFYLLFIFFSPEFHSQVIDFLDKSSSLKILLIFFFLILSHIIGELSLFPIFALITKFGQKRPLDALTEIDVTKEEDLINFFKSNFTTEALDSKEYLMHDFCKNFLLENALPSYTQAKRMEARINLKGGIIIPMVIGTIISLLYRQWILSIFPFLLAVIFFLSLRYSLLGEQKFIYNAYYNCLEKIPRQDYIRHKSDST